MTNRSIAEFLRDSLEAIAAIERFVVGLDQAALEQDEKTLFAISRAVEMIREAGKQEQLIDHDWFADAISMFSKGAPYDRNTCYYNFE